MRLWVALICSSLLMACSATQENKSSFGIEQTDLKSGYEFLTAENQLLQKDHFANPGFLWVENGVKKFQEMGCNECHKNSSDGMSGIAGSYPKIHDQSGELININGQVNFCRTERLHKDPLPYESQDMLALTAYLKSKSAGSPLEYVITPDLRHHFEKGKDYFFQRRGQFNLSCAQCHDENWGTKMRGDTVSQGHINGFPAFRNDWQTLGSAHRRFQACNIGVRAQTSELGSLEYLQLEVYLMARGYGLRGEAPSIRR